MPVEILTYKKQPILKLIEDNPASGGTSQEQNYKSTIQFGLRKAKLILQNLDEIKKFVEKNSVESPYSANSVEKSNGSNS